LYHCLKLEAKKNEIYPECVQISGGADHEKKISRPEKADSRLMLKLEAGKTDWGFEDRFPSAFSRDLYADCANQDNQATCGVRTLDPNVVRYIGMNSCDAEKDGVSEKIPRKYFDPIEEKKRKDENFQALSVCVNGQIKPIGQKCVCHLRKMLL
jgi:hypothetical protein